MFSPTRLYEAEVSESHFFILETRMRISLIQSRTSRRDREFLTLNLRLRDETEKKSPPISGIETRSRFIIFILRLRDENENSLDLISVFETRTRILKVAIFPWIQAWTASLFCMQFLGGCYIKCRALHFAWLSPILRWLRTRFSKHGSLEEGEEECEEPAKESPHVQNACRPMMHSAGLSICSPTLW